MRSMIIFMIIIATILIQNTGYVYAVNTLKVEKFIENSDIRVGDNVTVLLKFKNPFGREIPVRIVDKNIFGNNGLNIECLDYTISSKEETIIAYEPIRPFKSGNYTLSSAEVTYLNPETGREETVKSNTLMVSVKDSKSNILQGQMQGITTIYRCYGINMQSTSYSSYGGSLNVQIGSSGIHQQIQQQFNQIFNRQFNRQQPPENRVQNNQLNQNTKALKRQIEKQLKQQKQIEREFRENIIKNKEFQKWHRRLSDLGYNLTDISLNPVTNNTGSFEFYYQKLNGKNASLKGEIKNGTIKNMIGFTSEDKQKILHLLKENKEFRKYDSKLINEGFNQTDIEFNQVSQNNTKIVVSYENNAGEKRRIFAHYINGTIQNVSLENNHGEDKYKSNLLWLLLMVLTVIIVAILWIYYKKYMKKSKGILNDEMTEIKKPFDYIKEAKEMINKAEELFKNKREKDAYEKVSQAIRFYFSHALGIKRELMNSELMEILKREKIEKYNDVQKCLNLCSLVEFAKYKPNRNDFYEIIKLTRSIIL